MGVHLQLLEAFEALGREDPLGVPDLKNHRGVVSFDAKLSQMYRTPTWGLTKKKA